MSLNPYQPPSLAESAGRARAIEPVSYGRRRWFDYVTLFLAAIVVGAYGTFIDYLFRGNRLDQLVGYMFLLNVPILLAWVIQLFRKHRVNYQLGMLAVTVQFVMMVVILSSGIGNDARVIAVNGIIGLCFLSLTVLCDLIYRNASSPKVLAVRDETTNA